MKTDESKLQAVLEIMRNNGLFAARSEEQMQQLLLEVSRFVGESGAEEWEEFEDDDGNLSRTSGVDRNCVMRYKEI